jgi:hypothetical protein
MAWTGIVSNHVGVDATVTAVGKRAIRRSV